MQRVNAGGRDLLSNWEGQKKKKCDVFSFAAACSQFSVYINSCGNSSACCRTLQLLTLCLV